MDGADLSGAQLDGADLSGARLTGANLSGVRLRGVRLERADLRGVRLERADLTAAECLSTNQLELDLTRFRGHCGYEALHRGSAGMSDATSRIPASPVMGAMNVFGGDTEIAAPLLRVDPGASTELVW